MVEEWMFWLASGTIFFVGVIMYILNWYLNKHGDQYNRKGWR